jgi:hypothetical protein
MMMRSVEQRRLDWSVTRQKGKARFVIIHGVLGWGIATAIIGSIINWALNAGELFHFTPLGFVVFPICGVFVGWAMWAISEKRFTSKSE